MQKITFGTSYGTISVSDYNVADIDGFKQPIWLKEFDPNSVVVSADTVQCIGMDGQHIISQTTNPRSIKITLTFDGSTYTSGKGYTKNSENEMYYLRSLIMKHFPLKETGLLTYTVKKSNSLKTYYINARMTEYPYIEQICGTLCTASFYLVADYPYWRQDVSGNLYTVTYNDPVAVVVLTEGDIDSPVIFEMECVKKITGNTTGTFFKFWQIEGGDCSMSFVKNLEVGQKLVMNSGLNNQVYIKLIEADGTERYANEYVNYRDSILFVNRAGTTKWQFNIYGDTGEFNVQMHYQNLYMGV